MAFQPPRPVTVASLKPQPLQALSYMHTCHCVLCRRFVLLPEVAKTGARSSAQNLANLKFPLLNSSDSDQVAVIHAEGDPFTPKEQVAKIKSCGSLISMYECRDSHVFELFSSEDLIEKVFCRQFLQ